MTFKSKVDSKQRCMRLESFQHRLALRRDVASAATKTRLCRANQLCCTFISALPPPASIPSRTALLHCRAFFVFFTFFLAWSQHRVGTSVLYAASCWISFGVF